MEDYTLLDTSGLLCPIPMLKTKKALQQLRSGDKLKVITTDPASEKDIKSLLTITNDKLMVLDKQNGHFVFIIEKL